jgi:predicted component of type VI protein secretion system
MIPGYHDHEKFVQTHRQNLLNEAEHERRLAQLPQSDRSVLNYFLARPALILRSFRTKLQERAKRRKQQITRRADQ